MLWPSAEAAFDEGDLEQGLAYLEQAVRLDPADADAVCRQIRMLKDNGLRRQALQAVEKIPAGVCDEPEVRRTVGDFYLWCHCPMHAAAQLSKSSGMPRRSRRRRLLAGWAGVIPAPVRRRIMGWEEDRILAGLRYTPEHWPHMKRDTGLTDSALISLRTELDERRYAWSWLYEYWSAFLGWQRRLLPGAVIPVWLVLWGSYCPTGR